MSAQNHIDDPLPLPLPPGIKEFYLPSHDLTYHVLSAGSPSNPLILLLHGFPELAFSWRKIMPALASEGYHVVAYDQRGYGQTTGWDTRDFSSVDLNTFTFIRLVRDAVIFVNALGYREVECVIGHDFGSVSSSMCALMRPDIFKSVIMMSAPFGGTHSLPFDTISKPTAPTPKKENVHKTLASLPEPRKNYKLYFSTSAAADEMDNLKEDLHQFLRGYFYLKSADWKGNNPAPLENGSASELAKIPYYYIMPLNSGMRESVQRSMAPSDYETAAKLGERWLPDGDMEVYVQNFGRVGFQGSLNWYRVATNPTYMKDLELFAGRKIDVPSLFVSGAQDWGMYQDPGAVENMGNVCTKYKGTVVVDDAGHWVQQEQPEKVVDIVLKFLKEVKVESILH